MLVVVGLVPLVLVGEDALGQQHLQRAGVVQADVAHALHTFQTGRRKVAIRMRSYQAL